MEAARPIVGAPQSTDHLAHEPRYFMAPGLMSVYSELGVDLLGLVIADIAKEPHAQYLETEVLKPFDMARTTVGYASKIPHLVRAYQPDSPDNVEPLIYGTPITLPDGGVISTGEDMGRFILELASGSHADVFKVQHALNVESIASFQCARRLGEFHVLEEPG